MLRRRTGELADLWGADVPVGWKRAGRAVIAHAMLQRPGRGIERKDEIVQLAGDAGARLDRIVVGGQDLIYTRWGGGPVATAAWSAA